MSEVTTITCSSSNYVYYNNTNDYRHDSSEVIYIGDSDTTSTGAGTYRGYFCITNPYGLSFSKQLSKISSITLTITTRDDYSGYNNCVARIDFVGDDWDNGNATLWRFGGSDATINLIEGQTATLTATDDATLNNFRSMLKNAVENENAWFRVYKTSGMGAVIKADITFTITYEEGYVSYVYDEGVWKEAVPYVWCEEPTPGWYRATGYLFGSATAKLGHAAVGFMILGEES